MGFVTLTERLAQQGRAGAEEISRELNARFGRFIDVVTAHGGEVVTFAGDALIAAWPISGSDETLVVRTLRAVQCGLALLRALRDDESSPAKSPALPVGIAAGDLLETNVGGVDGQWEFVLAGPPLVHVGTAQRLARGGHVVVTPEAWALVNEYCAGHHVGSGFVRIDDVRLPPDPRPFVSPQLPSSGAAALRAYIPAGVLSRLDAGQTEWLAELRRVGIVFIKVGGGNFDGEQDVDKLHAAAQEMQGAISRFEGTIRQLIVDDKGTVLVAAFGLPPQTHEDDAVRAVKSALAARTGLRKLGLASSVGIATGRAFCGPVGSQVRREYAMIGDVVNLAARLMDAAEDDILCDGTTNQAASLHTAFRKLPAFALKGRIAPVAVYRPLDKFTTGLALRPMFGREDEKRLLATYLERLKQRVGGVLLIEGEPGIGKSRLIACLLQEATQQRVITFTGGGDAIEKSTLYHAWRSVFGSLFDVESARAPAVLRQRLSEQFQGDEGIVRLTPLLNVVLPLELPDNDFTTQLAGQLRADNTNRLLIHLLKKVSAETPVLIVIEDAHWLDSASWALTLQVSHEVENALLVLVTRPVVEPPAEYEQLLRSDRTRHLLLTTLAKSDTISLIHESFCWPHVAEPIGRLIHERAEGNPFFVEELSYALRDSEHVLVADGICQVAPGSSLKAIDLPETLQGVITSRIDQLAPTQQLALKVGSVIGRVFPLHVLEAVYPIATEKARLRDYAEILARLDLTPLYTPEPDLTYSFKHVTTQEVAYGLMVSDQRRQLHRAVAEWYEAEHKENDLAAYYPLLAHHWTRAEVVPKPVEYLEKAGDQAFHSGAYQEALRFFGEILAAKSTADPGEAPATFKLRRARWERQLAESYLGLGDHLRGREHLQQALRLLGRHEPTVPLVLFGNILGQVVLQVLHRMWSSRFLARSDNARTAAIEAARAYIRLVEVHWFRNETIPLVHAGIRALNLSEAAGPSPELVRAYAIMCISAGSIPQHGLAEIYGTRALNTAREVDNLPAAAYALFISSVYRIGAAKWSRIEQDLLQVDAMFQQLGDLRLLGDTRTVLGMSDLYQGDFTHAADHFTQVRSAGEQRENFQHQVWGLIGLAECEVRRGRMDEAERLLERTLALLEQHPDRAEELRAQGLLAIVRLHRGNRDLAVQAAARSAALIAELPAPTAHYLLEGYAGVAELYLTLWEESVLRRSVGESRLHSGRARRSTASLRKFARVFPIGGPRAWLWTGRARWLSGRRARAQNAWTRSLMLGQKLGMRYEQALAHYEIGQHVGEGDLARRQHLSQALELFTELGASLDAQRVKVLSPPR